MFYYINWSGTPRRSAQRHHSGRGSHKLRLFIWIDIISYAPNRPSSVFVSFTDLARSCCDRGGFMSNQHSTNRLLKYVSIPYSEIVLKVLCPSSNNSPFQHVLILWLFIPRDTSAANVMLQTTLLHAEYWRINLELLPEENNCQILHDLEWNLPPCLREPCILYESSSASHPICQCHTSYKFNSSTTSPPISWYQWTLGFHDNESSDYSHVWKPINCATI